MSRTSYDSFSRTSYDSFLWRAGLGRSNQGMAIVDPHLFSDSVHVSTLQSSDRPSSSRLLTVNQAFHLADHRKGP